MSLTLDLPSDVEAALFDLAARQGRSAEEVAVDRLTAILSMSRDRSLTTEDPQAVAEIGAALAEMNAAAEQGNFGMNIEDAFAELHRRQDSRLTATGA